MAVRRGGNRGDLAALTAIAWVHRHVLLATGASLTLTLLDLPLAALLFPVTGYLAAIGLHNDTVIATSVGQARTPLATRLGDPAVADLPPIVYARLGAAASPLYGQAYLPAAALILLLTSAAAARAAAMTLPGWPGALLVLVTLGVGLAAGPRLARAGAATLSPGAVRSLRRR
jgi:hypothetical protein